MKTSLSIQMATETRSRCDIVWVVLLRLLRIVCSSDAEVLMLPHVAGIRGAAKWLGTTLSLPSC